MKKYVLIFISVICLPLFSGWHANNKNITSFYYYKNKPFHLTLKTDKIFLRLKENISLERVNNLISRAGKGAITQLTNAPEDETRFFVDVNAAASNENVISEVINDLKREPDVEYVSPVFSPDNGKTLTGVENEIMVQFKPHMSDDQIQRFISNNGLTIKNKIELSTGKSYTFIIPKSKYAIDIANDIFLSGTVNWAEPNLYFTNLLCYTPNDFFYERQWSLRNTGSNIIDDVIGIPDSDMDVDSAWDVGLGNRNVIIAISDTGCDTLHEDLAANFIPGTGYNFYHDIPGAFDDNFHGTNCAGIVGAIGNNNIGISGICPNGKLIPIKWLNTNGEGSYQGAVNAAIYSYKKGAWVISNSWGFPGGASSALDQAITDAATFGRNGKGTVVVFAAGNEGSDLRYPANSHPHIITVGASSPCNQRISNSSCDNENFWSSNYGSNLHVVAPGVKIPTTDITGLRGFNSSNYHIRFNGTSSAAPNVAGVCGLILSADSSISWDTVRARIVRTSERKGSYQYNQPGPLNAGSWNIEMGYGIVNANSAVRLTIDMQGPAVSTVPLTDTENLSGPYTVNAVVTSPNSSINFVKLFWGRGAITDSIAMTNSSGNNWTANIPGTGNTAEYRYYIHAQDNNNRSSKAPHRAPIAYYSFRAGLDIIKPVIYSQSLPDAPKENWPCEVEASITDNIEVDSAWVRWYVNTPDIVKQFTLQNITDSIFSSRFNSDTSEVQFNDTVFYKIFARDNSIAGNIDSSALHRFVIMKQMSMCIGTGNGNIQYPFSTGYRSARTNILYTNNEINSAGNKPGKITKISFDVVSAATYNMENFNIRMQHTANTTLSGFTNNGWTTVYNDTHNVLRQGVHSIDLQTPFAYDGTSNILIEICFTNQFPTVDNSIIKSSAAPGMVYYRRDLNFNNGCTLSGANQGSERPNICFLIDYSTVGVNNITSIPDKFELKQNYPNPFNPVTRINFSLPKKDMIKLTVYDITGKEVMVLVNEIRERGAYSVDFNGMNLSSGIYFYRLITSENVFTRKMLLIK